MALWCESSDHLLGRRFQVESIALAGELISRFFIMQSSLAYANMALCAI